MERDPLAAVGLLVYRDSETNAESPLGTCAAFRQPHIALTAAHCVAEGLNDAQVSIEYPRRRQVLPVTRIERHPTADLAVLHSPSDPADDNRGIHPGAFSRFVGNAGLGEEFIAYGFPVEGPNRDPGTEVPTPRLFTGNYQRFFDYESPSGYHYLAGEMSIPAPAGLSGGPAMRTSATTPLTGIITTNTESYSTLDWVIEESKGGSPARLEAHHHVIRYGLALQLYQFEDWLDDLVPHRDRSPRARERSD